MYLSNLLVDISCNDGKQTRLMGPRFDVTVTESPQNEVEGFGHRRLQAINDIMPSVKRTWTNSMKYDSRPVSNLFDKKYETFWEVANNGNGNDVCIEFNQCVNVEKFWLFIPKNELTMGANTKIGDIKISSSKGTVATLPVITKKDPLEMSNFFWYTF